MPNKGFPIGGWRRVGVGSIRLRPTFFGLAIIEELIEDCFGTVRWVRRSRWTSPILIQKGDDGGPVEKPKTPPPPPPDERGTSFKDGWPRRKEPAP
jgi:hypothetical protein